MISVWLRVIRVRFLLASIIAVSVGLAITWWHTGNISIFDAILTMCGVLALHASVDLLNDYWDFKRGIDTKTHRTKMSGGSGVLPEGLLKPTQVYAAGIAFLIIGTIIGIYFVATDGIDGNTKYSGAIIENNLIKPKIISHFLKTNNSNSFFKKYGGLIKTGHTHFNLMDIGLILKY